MCFDFQVSSFIRQHYNNKMGGLFEACRCGNLAEVQRLLEDDEDLLIQYDDFVRGGGGVATNQEKEEELRVSGEYITIYYLLTHGGV